MLNQTNAFLSNIKRGENNLMVKYLPSLKVVGMFDIAVGKIVGSMFDGGDIRDGREVGGELSNSAACGHRTRQFTTSCQSGRFSQTERYSGTLELFYYREIFIHRLISQIVTSNVIKTRRHQNSKKKKKKFKVQVKRMQF